LALLGFNMRILVTGAFGNIGREVVRLLLQRGYRVRGFDINTKTNHKLYKSFIREPDVGNKFRMIWGDIRNPSDVFEAVKDVDAIIHLAAIIPPQSENDPGFARDINVGGTQNLMEAAKAFDPLPRFIFSSSVSIYGPRMTDPSRFRSRAPSIPDLLFYLSSGASLKACLVHRRQGSSVSEKDMATIILSTR